MRYAIFADVHSNLEALRVVVEHYYIQSIDRYIFLGDIVGYGGDPKDCIDILRDLKPLAVAGNHDWGVSGKLSTNYFNLHAKESIIWTKKQIKKDDLSYLEKFHLEIEDGNFICVHGSLKSPHEFNYVFDIDDAVVNFQLFKKKLCFVGHTHRPGIYCLNNDNVSYSEDAEVSLEEDKRYIVNVGSVGQPRDGDPRACCCVYDDQNQTVEIIRLNYDVAQAASSIVNQGLPTSLANRLYDGR